MKKISFKEGHNLKKHMENNLVSKPLVMEAKAGTTDRVFGYDYIVASQYSQHPDVSDFPAVILVFEDETKRNEWLNNLEEDR